MPTHNEFQVGSEETSRCESVAEGMHACVDGVADLMLRDQVEAHLRACANCAREMERLRGLVEDLRKVAVASPPEGLWPRIRDAVSGKADTGAGAGALLPALLLFPFDGELAERTLATGTCRERAGARHGVIALVVGVLMALVSLMWGGGLEAAWTAIPAVPLLWLASTRLEARWSAGMFALILLIGSVGLLGCEFGAWKGGLGAPPLGLCGAIATLAAAQAAVAAKVRTRVLGVANVPIALRSAGMILLAFMLARPDLNGATAAAATAFGALWGWVAAVVKGKTLV